MHETALARELVAIIEEAARTNGVSRVSSATLELGDLACVSPDALEFAFSVHSQGTVAEGCALAMRRVPLVVSCPACGHESPGDRDVPGCPACGHVPVRVVSGREMRLVSIDAEEDADA